MSNGSKGMALPTSAEELHVLSPAEEMSAQQMRELHSRLKEKSEEIQAMLSRELMARGRDDRQQQLYGRPAAAGLSIAPSSSSYSAGHQPRPQPQQVPFHRSNEHMNMFGERPYPPHGQLHAMVGVRSSAQQRQQQQQNPYAEGRNADIVSDINSFVPLPNLEHKTVTGAARAIESSLNVMLDSLHRRLPPDVSSMSLVERIKFNMQKEKEEAAAKGGAAAVTPIKAAAAGAPTSAADKTKATSTSPLKGRFGSAAAAPVPSAEKGAHNLKIIAIFADSVSTSTEVAGKMAAELVSNILPATTVSADKSATPAVPAAEATATPTVATAPSATPAKSTFSLKPAPGAAKIGPLPSALQANGAPKTAAQQLDDLDVVLGADTYHKGSLGGAEPAAGKKPVTTLGLGQFVAPSSAEGSQLMKNKVATPSAAPATGAKASAAQPPPPSYVPPLPWENRSPLSYQPSVDHRTLHGLMAPATRPALYEVPADQSWTQRQQQAAMTPSAPTQFAAPQLYPLPMQGSVGQPVFVPQQGQWGVQPSQQPILAAPYQFAAPPLRPVEGAAMQHLRLQQQHQQQQQQQHNAADSSYGSPYAPPLKSDQQYLYQQYLYQQYLYQQQQQYQPSQHNALSSPVSVAAAVNSPQFSAGASVREREAYLLKMRQLRLQHSAAPTAAW